MRAVRSRLIASKPRTSPSNGPKNATNCAKEKNGPVEVNSMRNTSEGLARPSSSVRSRLPVMAVMMRPTIRMTVRSSVNRALLH